MGTGSYFGTMTTSDHHHTYVYSELKPTPKPGYANIVYPFNLSTWIMFGSSLLAISLALWLLSDQDTGIAKNLQLAYGIMFQEYFSLRYLNQPRSYQSLRMIWVVATVFLSMAFLANLKSSLMKTQFNKRTMTLNEIVDKDMRVISSATFTSFLEDSKTNSLINQRLLCQIKKHNTTYVKT